MKHLLRYGTNAEQKHFVNGNEEMYDGIIINANMIAFSPDALANFIVKKTTDKPFIIDPITHAFQHNQSFISDKSGEKIKKSISKLIDSYGDNLKAKITEEDEKGNLLTKQQLRISDIDDDFIESFSRNVIRFQKEICIKDKVEKYVDYINFANEEQPELEISEGKIVPDFVVAPYFYIDSEEWLEKNIELVNKSKEIENELDVYAEIVIDKKVIEKAVASTELSLLSKIIEKYQGSNADGFLIWIDGYDEHDEISENLQKYLELLKGLKATNKKIYSLYGGYFSTLLTHKDIKLLDGVCHGLEYGESRAVIPVGGGLPVSKFYFYPLHKRINPANMFAYIIKHINSQQEYKDIICSCNLCQNYLIEDSSKPFQELFLETFEDTKSSIVKVKRKDGSEYIRTVNYPTSETKEKSLKHYLNMKKVEFESTENKDWNILIEELETAYNTFESYFDKEQTAHLLEWKKALETL